MQSALLSFLLACDPPKSVEQPLGAGDSGSPGQPGADGADGSDGADGLDGGADGGDGGSGDSGACSPEFPALDTGAGEEGGGGDSAEPAPELDLTGLLAHWPLDGGWEDSSGALPLSPYREGGFSSSDLARAGDNGAYGPTGEESENGAWADLPAPDLSTGLTMEAWYYKPDNNTRAVLMGFGGASWSEPKLNLQDSWGSLLLMAGQREETTTISFDRPTNGCWHHLALVLPPGVDTAGGLVSLYVDGVLQSPTSGDGTLPGGLDLLGGSFQAATFSLPYGASMRMDELRLWSRPLSAEEVALAAAPGGPGELCPSAREPWEPGPRCTFAEGELPSKPEMPMELRVLDRQTIVVMADPSPWLQAELEAHCGTYLSAMEENIDGIEEWWWRYQYHYALAEVLTWSWPVLQAQWAAPEAWRVAGCAEGEEAALPAETTRWITPTREARIGRLPPGSGTAHDSHAERLLVGYLRLPWPMQEGGTYAVRDRWGNEQSLVFRSEETLSWAIKINQVGGPARHPARKATLGAWLGPAGAMDLSALEGEPFFVVEEGSGEVALEGEIGPPRESAASGELLLDLDLSGLSEEGDYHVVVPGVGRSWSFHLGPEALGEAFATHAAGLTHNRCAPLEPELSAWARGDIHAVYQGAYPPDDDDYDDHSAEGWGFLDAGGGFVSLHHFDVVEATATDLALPAVVGGWHDAGDYDRRPQHLRLVHDLLTAWLLAPENFSDGQLDIPERENGRPDIVDEALTGLSMWRAAQQPDGGVGTWVEATSHPAEQDPGLDTQPYYLSLATRSSSLDYAREAALAARVLESLGEGEAAAEWLASAEAAWAFGLDPSPLPAVEFVLDGEALRFLPSPEPDPERRLWAALELYLSTADPSYEAELIELEETYTWSLQQLWWRQDLARAAPAAAAGDALPPGWSDAALEAILGQAEVWEAAQAANPYPWAWYDSAHRYHSYWGWGQGGYRALQDLALAWRLTGEERWRSAALSGLDVLLGLNPQGRVDTSGLGDHRSTTALHLPSWADGVEEVSPGITLYGALPSLAWQASDRVWGLSEGARSSPDYAGASLPMMPPPYAPADLDETEALLEELLPELRREVLLESSRPEEMEFTVFETVGVATAVTGMMMEPGWLPSGARRVPLEGEALRQNLWAMP